MGSRLKENPERTFNWFFEATCPIARDNDPGLLFHFPENFKDEESCKTLPRFCFPYDIQRVREGVPVQHFTFVLTDMEGCQQFGFCRLTNSTRTCLCMLSYLPWFEAFYKLLNNLADYLSKGQTNEIKGLLSVLYKQPIPLAVGSVTLQMEKQVLTSTEVFHPVGYPHGQDGIPYFIAPDPRYLPSIPESRNLTELIVAVDVGNLLQLYASMLFERRILIFASKLSSLTACVHALSGVLYPMYWQHIFIPVLPPHLLDYCCAPMPYLIGVHTSLTESVKSCKLEDVVILNVDTNTLETPFDDLKRIPADVVSGLKVRLKRHSTSPGWGVARAFLRAQAQLFGGYRDAFQEHKGGDIWFSEEIFLDHKSPSMRQFLQSAIHLQLFKQFIDSRLELLNKGKEPEDLFEEDILQIGTEAEGSKAYQQLVGNLKKGGGALILNMKSKANLTAKGFTKLGLKNLLINKAQGDANVLQRGGSVSHRRAQSDCLQNRLPITQHFGTSRPRRPLHKHRTPTEEENAGITRDTWDGAWSGPVADPDSELQSKEEEGGDSLLCEEMDLLGEIFETLSSRSSHERGLLYGTRSLDLFGPNSNDYIRTEHPANPSQESLSLSISGSESLHSWNLEEGLQILGVESDQTEEPDWLFPDPTIPEEHKSESPLVSCQWGEQEREVKVERENTNDQEKMEAAMKRNSGEEETDMKKTSCKEIMVEEKKKRNQEIKVGVVEETIKERIERQENNTCGGDSREENQDEIIVREGVMKLTEEPVKMHEDLACQGEKNEDKDKGMDMTGSLHRNGSSSMATQSNCGHNSVDPFERQQGQDTFGLDFKACLGSENHTADYDSEMSMVQGKGDEQEGGREEREVAQTSCSPKVLSAVARFQSQACGQGLHSVPRTWEGVDRTTQKAANTESKAESQSEPTEEEDLPPPKVSELKRRFEA
ncbi:DENN domain-containing protein 1B [Lampris incognitus]|uniref:DENN domain-containing protein 1B n=1 Tax=Lampris incognitus TaxID=2546036 RepID=UPI0024B51C43|nr:DENN domain-containing protein 1B [Lampris incognitus]